jgi:hypothetical protein
MAQRRMQMLSRTKLKERCDDDCLKAHAVCAIKKAPSGAFFVCSLKKSSSQGLIHKRSQLGFAQCAHFGCRELAFVEDHERGDAANAEFAGDASVVVDVELGDLELAVVGGGHFVQGGGNHFAGAAPFGPEINEHGHAGLQYISLEAGIGDGFDEGVGHRFLAKNVGRDV